MSFGVDTLGGLTEKLKQLVNDNQSLYESFLDATQLYKQGKIGEREFFGRIGEFLVASSALSFLSVRVILELKGALDKGTTVKTPTGGSGPSPQQGFGLGSFVGAGGSAGSNRTGANDSILPLPESETGESLQTNVANDPQRNVGTKNCIACGAAIPVKARFCSKCGHSQ
jgi:ribosomal protein L40E